MSGVIIDGIQWERCNECGEWENIDYLSYGKSPTNKWPGRIDLCRKCVVL